jgi:hypothetical protein
MATDNGAVRLPAIPLVSTGNVALDRWVQAVTERLEVREGGRGNPYERVVLRRELTALGLDSTQWGTRVGSAIAGVMVQSPDGRFTRVPLDAFTDEIRKTKLYKDLTKSISDVSRFDGIPQEVRALLLSSLADEAKARGADIQHLERKVQTETESLAYSLKETTAAINGSMAGVRETVFAAATESNATAGKLTQLTAALDGTGSATAEESLTVIADRTAGLSSQYMLKLNAGKAVAAVGLMASEDPTGATESKFIVQADQFGLAAPYTFAQEATPSATAIGDTWYVPSTELTYRATATGTGSWVSFTPPIPFGVDTVTGMTYINGNLRIGSPSGTQVSDLAALTSYGTAYAYKRSATDLIAAWDASTNGPGAVTWTFASGAITTPATDALSNGWTKAIPAGTDPLYVTVASAVATGATDTIAATEWASPAMLAQNGTSGLNVATAILYQRNASATVGPTAQANTVTFTFATGGMSGMSAGWTAAIPDASGGAYLWVTRATASGTGTTDTLAAGEWSTPVLYTQNGTNGTNGSNGAVGATGTRGTIVTKITGAWNATSAAAAVASIATAAGATPTYPIKGDIVYYTGGANECTVAGSPGTWAAVAAYIDGSLVVTGTVSVDKLAAGTITAEVSINSTGYIKSDGNYTSGSYAAAGHFNSGNAATNGLISYAGNSGAGVVGYVATGITGTVGAGVQGGSGVAGIAGMIAYHNASGYALKVQGKATFNNAVESSLATGTAPLAVTSKTVCANLNSEFMSGYKWGANVTPSGTTVTSMVGLPSGVTFSGMRWLPFTNTSGVIEAYLPIFINA